MDDRETYMNVKITKTDSRSLSRGEPDVSYGKINFKTVSEPRVRTDRDGLNCTYSELNFRKEEHRIDEDEDPPSASGPGVLSNTAPTSVQKQESKRNIGNRPSRKICLLCLVTSILIAIVAGLSVHVSQIRQSQITSDIKYQLLWEQYQEMNRTQSQCRQQVHQLKLSNYDCVHNLSVISNNFSIHNKTLRTLKWTKGEICQFLTSSREFPEQTCSKDWIINKDRCYYVSTFETSSSRAVQECLKLDSRLLEICSKDEESFVSHNLAYGNHAYWIGKCKDGNVAWSLLFKVSSGTSECGGCDPNREGFTCDSDRRFMCEKSAALFRDIPEHIQDLCQQPVEAT
ncbi:uncharacterized protein [Mobula birostris]|uniref:uncharacterized protein isoform X2 n=1 Tax=Mobula birostris TaxID=1983395 RepID=UPI003B282FD9